MIGLQPDVAVTDSVGGSGGAMVATILRQQCTLISTSYRIVSGSSPSRGAFGLNPNCKPSVTSPFVAEGFVVSA